MSNSNLKGVSFSRRALMKVNPNFMSKRLEYLESKLQKPRDIVEPVFQLVSNDLNKTVTRSGIAISTSRFWRIFLLRLGVVDKAMPEIVSFNVSRLYLDNPPLLYDDNVLSTLDKYADNIPCAITSNCLSISEDYILSAMKSLKITPYIKYFNFSNQYAKPSPQMFMRTYLGLSNSGGILPSEIVHIGTNYETDIIGATKFGFHAVQVYGTGASKITSSTLDETLIALKENRI